MDNQTWKEQFDSVKKSYEVALDPRRHFNFRSLYNELENLGNYLIRSGQMDPNETYDINIENGSVMHLGFVKCGEKYRCTLSSTDIDEHNTTLISEQILQQYKREDKAISTILDNVSKNGNGIGRADLTKFLSMMMFTIKTHGSFAQNHDCALCFDGLDNEQQKMYYFKNNQFKFKHEIKTSEGIVKDQWVYDDSILSIPYIYQYDVKNHKQAYAEDFDVEQKKAYDLSNSRDLQKFYNAVKTPAGNVFMRLSSEYADSYTCFDKLSYKDLKRGQTHYFWCGNTQFKAAWPLFQKKKYIENLHNKSKITFRTATEHFPPIERYLRWISNAPVVLEFSDKDKVFNNIESFYHYAQYEHYLTKGDEYVHQYHPTDAEIAEAKAKAEPLYKKAGHELELLCQEQEDGFSIKIHSFVSEQKYAPEAQFRAVSLCLKNVRGQCEMTRTIYKENDFNKPIDLMEKSSADAFAHFYMLKQDLCHDGGMVISMPNNPECFSYLYPNVNTDYLGDYEKQRYSPVVGDYNIQITHYDQVDFDFSKDKKNVKKESENENKTKNVKIDKTAKKIRENASSEKDERER